MRLKTVLLLVLAMTAGVVFSSYFIGGVLTTQVIGPFSSINTGADYMDGPGPIATDVPAVTFIDAELIDGWIPWIIKQVSILIGGLSLIVFVYAGVMLIIYGDNEEQLTKSSKMIVFGIIGIVLAAFSYSIVANVLSLF
ncbi:MAG: hypothetical protein AB7J40_02505 [Candidatus Altimarinota bacterium]